MRLQPDPELTLIGILRGSTALASLVGTRIHSRLPDGVAYPCIRVQAIGGVPVVRGHLDAALVQISAFGPADSKAILRTTIDTARAVCEAVENATTSSAVVTDVRTTSPIWQPSDEPDLSQYLLTATVAIHPLPSQE
jgi:hypothetical protein